MTPLRWPAALAGGDTTEEYALAFDAGRDRRLLIVPALFDEANKLRRVTVEIMRRLDGAGIDAILIDLPGCNESEMPLDSVTLGDWHSATTSAVTRFGATHLLTFRGGALVAPDGLPGWAYAPVKGQSLLRQMLRARVIASREAGREESTQGLQELGSREGLDLAGYRLSADMFAALSEAEPVSREDLRVLEQTAIGGPGLWLRAEPDYDEAQAEALAATIAIGMNP